MLHSLCLSLQTPKRAKETGPEADFEPKSLNDFLNCPDTVGSEDASRASSHVPRTMASMKCGDESLTILAK